ncbi:non-canonical purine NTP pyrophosphatase [Methanosarcina siciliae]|nr:non-canonical purine NTP pyrophosphatase [Methanosarcina siciliae]
MEKIPLLLVTTSLKKYKHLEYLAKKHHIEIYWANKEYKEIQENDMYLLLNSAMKEIPNSLKKTFLIIEQTSVFLDSYEKSGVKGPGYYFKDWWGGKSFEELKIIVSRNPRASIESGIALNIPNYSEPLIFKNMQKGRVSFEGKILEENEKYEWLKDRDFNFYFVPDGAKKVYCNMEIDEFIKYDFRRPSFEEACKRIDEYSAIINSGLSIEEIKKMASKYSMKEFAEEKPKITKQSTIDYIVGEEQKGD